MNRTLWSNWLQKKWVVILSVVVLAVLVRLPFLNGSLWLDEAAQALESTRPWSQQFDLAPDFQPPLFHLVTYGFGRFSHQESWLRLASVIPAVLGIGWVVKILHERGKQQAALVAGGLLAVSAVHVFFSQELRPYALATLWSVLSWEYWIQLMTAPRRWSAALLALTLAAGFLTSYVFVFWWMGMLLVTAALYWPKIWSQIRVFMVASVIWLTWWPNFLLQWRAGQSLRFILPGWSEVVSPPFLKALPLLLAKMLVGPVEIDLNLLFLVLFGGFYLAIFIWVVRSISWKFPLLSKLTATEKVFWASIGMCVLALGLAWLFSLFTPVFAPKRILYVIPVLVGSMAALGNRALRWSYLMAVFFACLQLGSLGLYWTTPQYQREDWRDLIQEVEHQFDSSDTAVIFGFEAPFAPWPWYQQENFTTFSTGTLPLTSVSETAEKLKGVTEFPYVLVFDYLRDLTDPDHTVEQALHQLGYKETRALDRPNIGFVRVYEQQRVFAQHL